MKKVYYILLLCTQYFVFHSKCSRITKKGKGLLQENSLEANDHAQRSMNVKNPWEKYMEIFDIEKNHGSGIRVDLGEDAEVEKHTYRLPGGKCPVFGKGITIENSNKSFLDRVATGNQKLKSGGFAFPNVSGTEISPLTIDALKLKYRDVNEFKDLDDISLCKKHATNYTPSNDPNTTYRHPAVFDIEKKLCYILYISAQENLGPRYCDSNKENEDGMFCFKPEKDDKYKNLVYLSKNVREDWSEHCPRENLGSSKFGLWVDGNCEDIPKKKTFEAENLSECNKYIFEASASDQPKQYEEELTDYERLAIGFNGNSKMIGNVLVPKGAISVDRYKSHGRGYNWGNYNKKTKECEIFKVKPTCLINDADYIATTALSHPTEIKNEFPCDIYKNAIEKYIQYESKLNEISNDGKNKVVYPRIFISTDKESLNCPCEPEKLNSTTCGYYLCKCVEKIEQITEENEVVKKDELNNVIGSDKKKIIVIIAIIIGIGLLASCFIIFFLRKRKADEKYDKMKEVEDYGKSNSRKDEVLDPEASFWGEEKRVSHTTPVLLEKPYY